METLVLQAFNGLSVGSILLLVALGLAFTFGLMGVINMAHGEFLMLGAYAAYVVQAAFTVLLGSAPGVYFVVALIAAFLLTAVLGMLLEDRKSTRLNSSHANISYAV